MKVATKKDMDRLRRLIAGWRKDEARLAEKYGSTILPGSFRHRQQLDAEAMQRVLDYLDNLRGNL